MEAEAARQSRLIGAILVENGLITRDQLVRALEIQEETGEKLGEIVVAEFEVPRIELASVLAEQWAAIDGTSSGRTVKPAGALRVVPASRQQDPAAHRPIGEMFLELGFITEEQLDAALEQQSVTGERIGEVLVEQGSLTRLGLASALAEQWSSLEKLRPPSPEASAPDPTSDSRAGVHPGTSAAVDGSVTTAYEDRLTAIECAMVERLGDRSGTPGKIDTLMGEVASLSARLHELAHSVADGSRGSDPDPAEDVSDEHAPIADMRESIANLRASIAEIESVRVADALAAGSRFAGVERTLGRLASQESVDRALGELRAEIGAVAGAPTSDQLDEAIAELVARIDRIAADVDASVISVADELATRVDANALELGKRVGRLEDGMTAEIAAARGEMGSLGARLDEVLELRHTDIQAARAVDERLAEQVEALAARLEDEHGATRSVNAELALELVGLADSLRVGTEAARVADEEAKAQLAELERLGASMGWRLERIEESLAADETATLRATVQRLDRQVEEHSALRDEQARATERALRKGLASLGERLVDTESAYVEAGNTLRRSIERLGAAVVEADARMADQIPVSPLEGCVAFAPTADGYRLIELPGTPPEVGAVVAIVAGGDPLVVTRYGRSPLPFDGRPCAYLDRS